MEKKSTSQETKACDTTHKSIHKQRNIKIIDAYLQREKFKKQTTATFHHVGHTRRSNTITLCFKLEHSFKVLSRPSCCLQPSEEIIIAFTFRCTGSPCKIWRKSHLSELPIKKEQKVQPSHILLLNN